MHTPLLEGTQQGTWVTAGGSSPRGLQGLRLGVPLSPRHPPDRLHGLEPPPKAVARAWQPLPFFLSAGLESLGSASGKAWIRAGVGMGMEGVWVEAEP